MSSVDGVGGSAPTAASRRPAAARAGGFAVVPEIEARPGAMATGAAAVGLETMLALQEAADAPERDRAARRHGSAMLASLTGLQRALLRPGSDLRAALAELAELAGDLPPGADPTLAGVLAAIRLRVRVELARHGD